MVDTILKQERPGARFRPDDGRRIPDTIATVNLPRAEIQFNDGQLWFPYGSGASRNDLEARLAAFMVTDDKSHIDAILDQVGKPPRGTKQILLRFDDRSAPSAPVPLHLLNS